jgi:acetyl-CoA carboxylase carboxyl transferase subunit alpha
VTKRERLRERIRRSRALAAERKENKRKAREGTVTTSWSSKDSNGRRPSDTLGEANSHMTSDARNLEKQRQRAIDSLERDVEELTRLSTPSDENAAELERIRDEVGELKREFYTHLGPWQRLLIARHPQRPYTDDFIRLLFENFSEIHGDRGFGDDAALITGMARFRGRPVMIVGSQKGRDTKQRLVRNFGQAKPEGYRKSLRAMELAAKFRRPIFVFVDTPGAYPGVGAEERGQAEAIAFNLREMSRLPVPIVVTITGEGGSGGALAVAVGDRVFMLENSVYSVISPEGCASIMWRDSSKAETAAEALKITAKDLLAMKLIDEIVPEPEGGAHFDHDATARLLEPYLERSLRELMALAPERLVEQRYQKFRHMGQFFG